MIAAVMLPPDRCGAILPTYDQCYAAVHSEEWRPVSNHRLEKRLPEAGLRAVIIHPKRVKQTQPGSAHWLCRLFSGGAEQGSVRCESPSGAVEVAEAWLIDSLLQHRRKTTGTMDGHRH